MDIEILNKIGLKCPRPRKIQLSSFDRDGELRPRTSYYVPCGKCYVCLSSRRMQWQFRLEMESLQWKNSLFVTLSFNDDFVHDVCKRDLQLLFKSLRSSGHCFKYYAIGEYGTRTKRPHYHVLFFTDDDLVSSINRYWPYGFTYFGDVTPSSIGYVLHYHVRPKIVNGKSTFSLMSKGLGVDFFDLKMQKYVEMKGDFIVRNRYGTKSILPRYYRKKFLSDKEISDESKCKYSIPAGLERSFDYWESLCGTFDLKLAKFNEQDKF